MLASKLAVAQPFDSPSHEWTSVGIYGLGGRCRGNVERMIHQVFSNRPSFGNLLQVFRHQHQAWGLNRIRRQYIDFAGGRISTGLLVADIVPVFEKLDASDLVVRPESRSRELDVASDRAIFERYVSCIERIV